MRKIMSSLLMASLLACLTATAAAAQPASGCPMAKSMDLATFSSTVESLGGPVEASEAAFIRADKNRDGLNGVLTQVLLNDASGSDTRSFRIDVGVASCRSAPGLPAESPRWPCGHCSGHP
jgi:hypothetical protein